MIFMFFLNFCCLMTLLRYLGVGAGAEARPVAGTGSEGAAGVGAGTGTEVEVGADTNIYIYTDLAFLWYLGWGMSPVDFWKRGEIISIASHNKIDAASLAVTDQLICT